MEGTITARVLHAVVRLLKSYQVQNQVGLLHKTIFNYPHILCVSLKDSSLNKIQVYNSKLFNVAFLLKEIEFCM